MEFDFPVVHPLDDFNASGMKRPRHDRHFQSISFKGVFDDSKFDVLCCHFGNSVLRHDCERTMQFVREYHASVQPTHLGWCELW
jgi:hypothetical protein